MGVVAVVDGRVSSGLPTTSMGMATAVVRADGGYELDLKFDVLAYLLNELPEKVDDGAMNALTECPSSFPFR